MQVGNRLNAAAAAGDGLGNLAGRPADQTGAASKSESGAQLPPASFLDPTPRISLSADALLYLGRTKRTLEKLPPLTKDEWNNHLSPQLAAREHQAFGKFAQTADYRAYYRGFIDYYDNLRPEDQNSLRYFGTREAAVAGLRSLEYDVESGLDIGANFEGLVSVFLEENKTALSPATAPPPAERAYFAWDASNISYEHEAPEPRLMTEIERLYSELI
ncbi:biotin biosynthesis protein BioC [Sinorhizobium medicae]|uniref:Biotin biosynthesis protein BioC n=2 Tax=Sinorhizobium medicae TaxID=110321 RepID=A0A6G1WUQ1_9HYPH|nr:biotin biosynthesis protein BioC [Sinorhizobium medicae]ABR60021.1 biotin-regulated protein [Sinorhizobium medicae WSM419]MBO1940067.1 biotin biosynthesis protein BioC [Sinorhizobium medicae]MBO1962626.1 biotin biosynthesis protein BioC [Sinorhizobium medicae]MDX0406399.1 biotin biosynthesis protein BioC [Sinorhizobium medicae]MDX0412117.1 biotin biosynthesis protein BioC [Sinorhizobium medicae]